MTVIDPRAVAIAGLLKGDHAAGTTAWLDASGASMEPLIPAGSRLLIEFGRRPDRVGDVILFRRGERVVAHRLVAQRAGARGDVFFAKGDHEAFLDPALADDDILGVVREVVRPDGGGAPLALGGRRGSLIAWSSWLGGRAAGVGARGLRRSALPPSIGRAALGVHLALSRVPTRVITALMPRLDRGRSAGRR